MECPYCNTENRIDRETCYHCGKDISMLRLISNKARHHYNLALEHAERHRYYEAIAELQNALDLDSNLVEAHVVLGTVYARLNRPDEAREQWERALGINKPFEKAHTYLQQMRRLRPYRGMLRRLRLILAGFVVAIGLVLILLLNLLWPNVPARRLDRAWRAYKNDNLAVAKKALDELSRPLPDTALELSAESLALALERDFQEAMAGIERLRRQDHPYQAMESAQAYLRRRPPEYAAEAVEQAIREIRSDLVEDLRGRMVNVGESTARLDQTKNALRRFLERFPDAPERDDLAREFSMAEAHFAAQRLEDIRQAYSRSRDYLSASASLRALLREIEEGRLPTPSGGSHSALRSEVEAELQRITAEEFARLMEQARQAMDTADLRSASAALERASHLPIQDEMKQARLASLRQELQGKQKTWLVDTMKSTVARRDWDAALAAADQVTSLALDQEARKTLEQLVDRARRARAVDTYHWLMRHARKIEELQLTEAEARDVVDRSQTVLRDLPMDLYPAALDDVLYFLASGQRALGRNAEARHTLDRLRNECPHSRYLASLDPQSGLPRAWTQSAGSS